MYVWQNARQEGRKHAVLSWWRIYIFYTRDISWNMFSLMMQSPTYVNIYYAECANGAQEKWEILVFKLGVRETILHCVFKTTWEVTACLLFSWLRNTSGITVFFKYKNLREEKSGFFWKSYVSLGNKNLIFFLCVITEQIPEVFQKGTLASNIS